MLSLFRLSAVILTASLIAAPDNARAAPRPLASIAAIVNGAPVSFYDLDQYIRLNLATSGVEWNEANAERVRERSFEKLIEDQLKLQEAQRLGIQINGNEVEAAMGRMVAQSNLDRSAFVDYLQSRNIEITALQRRISADIAWNKIIRSAIAPKILIRQQEVDRALARQNASAGETRYLLSEILITAEKGEEAEKRNAAEELREQLTHSDTSFALAAGQFSDAPSALSGGDIGWIGRSALREEWRDVVPSLSPKEVSQVLPTREGFYLLFLRDRQLATENPKDHQQVRLLSLRFPSARTEEEAQSKTGEMEANFIDCDSSLTTAQSAGGEFDDFGYISTADLSDEVEALVQDTELGKAVRSRISAGGADILFLCDRREAPQQGPSRAQIEYSLTNQQAGTRAVQYLRDLRRNSEVDIRL